MKADETSLYTPGPIILFGSGETSPSGRKVFEHIMRQMSPAPRVALLETPAGFELNSAQVSQRVATFLEHNLQNYHPQTFVIAARQHGTAWSPDDPEIIRPLLDADLIFMGPGSPTYAVRQLRDSLAWHYLVARHRLGAAIVLASAAVIAVSAQALPVYEIYKVGEDLHWKPGLDLFGAYGLSLVFVPHWDNIDGGDEFDTSRCFMGQRRFDALGEMLPAGQTVLGIDEKTALIMDIQAGTGRVLGQGGVSLLYTPPAADGTARPGQPAPLTKRYLDGQQFPLAECCPLQIPEPGAGLPAHVWHSALQAATLRATSGRSQANDLPEAVLALVSARQEARLQKDWSAADRLRKEILDLGWNVADGPDGPMLVPRSGGGRG